MKRQKMTAFGTYNGQRVMIESEYSNKERFHRDMVGNGYRSVRVYNEEDMEHLEEILEYKFCSYRALKRWRRENGIY